MTMLLAFLLVTIASFWRAYVVSRVWAWFAVPIASWVPAVTPLQAYGLLVVYTLVTWKAPDWETDKEKAALSALKLVFQEVAVTTIYFIVAMVARKLLG
jgi:hypothetical protein